MYILVVCVCVKRISKIYTCERELSVSFVQHRMAIVRRCLALKPFYSTHTHSMGQFHTVVYEGRSEHKNNPNGLTDRTVVGKLLDFLPQ